jgi:hypothetical protein
VQLLFLQKKESFTIDAYCNLGEACFVPYGALFKEKPYRISAASSSIDEYNLKSYRISGLRLTDDTELLNKSTTFLNSNYSAFFSNQNLTGFRFLLTIMG